MGSLINIAYCLLLVGTISFSQTDGYLICDNDINEEKVAMAREEVIKRILELRNADGTWDNYGSTELTLLVAAPSNFTEKSKTLKVLKQQVKNNYSKMTTRQLSTIAFAMQAACDNNRNVYGIDLLKIIEARLRRQYIKESILPKDGYFQYSIGVGVLCGSDYPIPPKFVENLINAQNRDGSFGKHSTSDTTMLGPVLYCLSQMNEPKFSVRKVENAIAKMRKYLISQVTVDENGKTWIGDEDISWLSLLVLWKTKTVCEMPNSWKCNEVMKSLGSWPNPEESLVSLQSRLMRFSGALYSDSLDVDWSCKDREH